MEFYRHGMAGWSFRLSPREQAPLELSARLMHAIHRATVLLLALGCWSGVAAEPTFYRTYMSVVATNEMAWEIRSPSLVDTNNTGYKLTNALVNLASIKITGALAGVRPGMTMDEVVGCWGKPMELWVKGFGGPRFRYREVSVFFELTGNSVKSIYTQDLPSLMRTIEITPKIQECLRALGEPSYRDDSATGSQGFLVYETPKARLKIGCVRGKLSSIQLEQPD